MYKSREYFDLLKIENTRSPFLHRFLEFYRQDVPKYFPNFSIPDKENTLILFVMRNLKPTGLFMGRLEGGTCHVLIDYVTPQYRDMKGARFLMEEKRAFFREQGVHKLISEPFCPEHERYLKKIGFVEEETNKIPKRYIREFKAPSSRPSSPRG
jgi:hypothetical protein